ncbi:transmembrane protein 174 isoform X1 [Xyrichtys novacula]|uniref:Transmembrane protein 174 isoform X1 n=1 Tax=Xyrichtys novacula TaxID=13765 RepID=A0AAV1GA81_XYRNO|nr:transmembrane protein 174 isoform X1 [Xyrichtys novacula]
MNQQRCEGFWTNMVVQRPVMETNRAGNPIDDLSQVGLPALYPYLSEGVLEGRKAGAALMFSGVFLALLGIALTAMGWQYYKAKPEFEWIQLLGPVLISVGGTFVLTSVCKFPVLSCCRNMDEEAPIEPVTEQTSTGSSLSFISNPVLLHGSTTMLCLPPAYSFIAQEVQQGVEIQPGGSVSGVRAGSPPYDAMFSNSAFTAREEESQHHSPGRDNRPRIQGMDDDRRGGDEGSSSTSLHPPAYEDIFPSFNKHNST